MGNFRGNRERPELADKRPSQRDPKPILLATESLAPSNQLTNDRIAEIRASMPVKMCTPFDDRMKGYIRRLNERTVSARLARHTSRDHGRRKDCGFVLLDERG
jgi:hypothetical protein